MAQGSFCNAKPCVFVGDTLERRNTTANPHVTKQYNEAVRQPCIFVSSFSMSFIFATASKQSRCVMRSLLVPAVMSVPSPLKPGPWVILTHFCNHAGPLGYFRRPSPLKLGPWVISVVPALNFNGNFKPLPDSGGISFLYSGFHFYSELGSRGPNANAARNNLHHTPFGFMNRPLRPNGRYR